MITTAQRQQLRGLAHALNPVVMIGDKGLVDTVFAEIDRALKVHELIKIRVLSDEREDRAQAMAQICKTLNCEAVQIIGKLLVVYRQRTEEETAERARLQADRTKRARIRNAAKAREAEPTAPTRRPRTSPAPLREGTARSPYPRPPSDEARKNRGVNSRVTRGSVDGAATGAARRVAGAAVAPRPPRPSLHAPAPARSSPARPSSGRTAPARSTGTRAPATRAPANRSARPPRKSGY